MSPSLLFTDEVVTEAIKGALQFANPLRMKMGNIALFLSIFVEIKEQRWIVLPLRNLRSRMRIA